VTIWTFKPADGALPLTMMFLAFGLAAWANGLFFIGYGAKPEEGGAHPVKTVGVISFIAGLAGWATVVYFSFGAPGGPGGIGIAVAALAAAYALFFTALGLTAWLGLDLKPIANICIPIAIWSLPFIGFAGFNKDLWMQSVMVVWAIAFALIWAVVYGKAKANWLGWWLLLVAVWTFLLPALRIATGSTWLIVS
jgi:hypothetical protein